MRYALAILVLLAPLTSSAETQGIPTPDVAADVAAAWKGIDLNSSSSEWAPYGNPYAPSSLTNFEALIDSNRLLLGRQGRDRSDIRSVADFNMLEGQYDGVTMFNAQPNSLPLYYEAPYEFFRR